MIMMLFKEKEEGKENMLKRKETITPNESSRQQGVSRKKKRIVFTVRESLG